MNNKNTDGIYGWSYSSYEETDNWEATKMDGKMNQLWRATTKNLK